MRAAETAEKSADAAAGPEGHAGRLPFRARHNEEEDTTRSAGSGSWRPPERQARSSRSSTPGIVRILQTPEMSARLAELGAEPASYKPDEFLAFIKRDDAKWDKLIRERKIEVERVTLAL
ncbi:MAG: hypothetical protein JWO70_3230 [Betaproteobacteria bacterium]|nr:hypothetical protein [Betaproteobacteria bacterium]